MGAVIPFPWASVRPAAEPYAGLREKVAEMFRREAAAQASQAAVERQREEEIGRVLRRIERRLGRIERLAAAGDFRARGSCSKNPAIYVKLNERQVGNGVVA